MGNEEQDRLLLWMGYSGLALAVFILVGWILFNMGTGDRVYEDYYVREFALVENAILSANGDLTLDYEVIDKKGEFALFISEDCEVKSYRQGKEFPFLTYNCLRNEFIDKGDDSINLDHFRFKLVDGLLLVEDIA
jgi:hypothetical protein